MSRTSAPADPRLAAVILAAGGSSRLGRPKQLLRYRGATLIERAVRLARRGAACDIVVVVGDQRQRLRSLLRRREQRRADDGRLTIVGNARWAAGLATSLNVGIGAVPTTAKAALILVVDQARLDAEDIERLVAAWQKRPSKPAAARYLERAGVPAVIPRRWFPALASLTGDVGARQVLRRLDDVSLVDMPAAAFDVDLPADAESLGA
ncbi:MAG TPA: nucleotidyltransferase family protein [Gammaproteobacteria bacterium]|nr:nucleotidyltransferase family protein [Gammaproteobacteria bacterium]